MRERNDFVKVRLSAAGRAFAGKGETLRIVTSRMHYLFQGDALVEVLRFAEWPLLVKHHDDAGRPLFEVFVPAVIENRSEVDVPATAEESEEN